MRRSEILLEFDAKMTAEKLGQAIFMKLQNDKRSRAEQKIVSDANREYGIPPNAAFIELSDKKALMIRYHIGAVNYVSSFDPTPNKSYSRWMCQKFVDGGIQQIEDLPKAYQYLQQFHKLKTSGYFKRAPENAHLADIGRFKTLSDLGEFLLARSAEDAVSKAAQDRKLQVDLIKSGRARLLLDNERFRVVAPETPEAATVFGRNTQWCTTMENGDQFAYYMGQGPLYIILDKPSNKRWQFHFETKSFMDENDRSIYNYNESDRTRHNHDGSWKMEKRFDNFPDEFWDVVPGEMILRGFDVMPRGDWNRVGPADVETVTNQFQLSKIILKAPAAIAKTAADNLAPSTAAYLYGYVTLKSLVAHEHLFDILRDRLMAIKTNGIHTEMVDGYEVTEGNFLHVMIDNFQRHGGSDLWRWIGQAISVKTGVEFLTRFPDAVMVVSRNATYFVYRRFYEVFYAVLDDDAMFDERAHGTPTRSALSTSAHEIVLAGEGKPSEERTLKPQMPQKVCELVARVLDPKPKYVG